MFVSSRRALALGLLPSDLSVLMMSYGSGRIKVVLSVRPLGAFCHLYCHPDSLNSNINLLFKYNYALITTCLLSIAEW